MKNVMILLTTVAMIITLSSCDKELGEVSVKELEEIEYKEPKDLCQSSEPNFRFGIAPLYKRKHQGVYEYFYFIANDEMPGFNNLNALRKKAIIKEAKALIAVDCTDKENPAIIGVNFEEGQIDVVGISVEGGFDPLPMAADDPYITEGFFKNPKDHKDWWADPDNNSLTVDITDYIFAKLISGSGMPAGKKIQDEISDLRLLYVSGLKSTEMHNKPSWINQFNPDTKGYFVYEAKGSILGWGKLDQKIEDGLPNEADKMYYCEDNKTDTTKIYCD